MNTASTTTGIIFFFFVTKLISIVPFQSTEKPDPKVAEEIIQRCKKLCPQLVAGTSNKELKIMSHNVGRRPSRVGGTRIEIEIKEIPKGVNGIICHNYGHHSYGKVLYYLNNSLINYKNAKKIF